MFMINDYKSIIQSYWNKIPDKPKQDFQTFQEIFSYDTNDGQGAKKMTKWISYFNSHRNMLAHEGTKEKGLNKEEVEFLRKLYYHFYEE